MGLSSEQTGLSVCRQHVVLPLVPLSSWSTWAQTSVVPPAATVVSNTSSIIRIPSTALSLPSSKHSCSKQALDFSVSRKAGALQHMHQPSSQAHLFPPPRLFLQLFINSPQGPRLWLLPLLLPGGGLAPPRSTHAKQINMLWLTQTSQTRDRISTAPCGN